MADNDRSFRIPHTLIISAVLAALLGLGGWALILERTKADKAVMEVARTALELAIDKKADKDQIAGQLGRIEKSVEYLVGKFDKHLENVK
jgi:hypothetical protein